jgi:luciferase family oxidoreductase group 1
MPTTASIPRSVLDLSPIVEGGTASQALRNTIDLAQHAQRWGYRRYWLAEHHNMPGIASAATAVVIAYVAGATTHIRVGSGGVMLPNHAPLIIAEQFGTLEAMYPGRIDLGLGRAPGTDGMTAYALRRNMVNTVDTFPQDVLELQQYFARPEPDQHVRAVPGAGLNVPIWLLGSSLYSASLAAMLGLPFAFASHFAPAQLLHALRLYRAQFKPSATLSKPHVMVAANVYAADTDAEARRLLTSAQQQFLNLRRGKPTPLQPPVDDITALATPQEVAVLDETLKYSLIGSPERIRRQLAALIEETQPDELIFSAHIFDHAARLRSFELLAGVFA